MTVMTYQQAVEDFLAQKRIAVAGVSSSKKDAANAIYNKLKGAGYQVFAVNPRASKVEGDVCYPDLESIPEKPEAVVAATPPEGTDKIVRDCARLGISRVWMHRSLAFLGSSVSDSAVQFCRENKIQVLAGGCPMMFVPPVDPAHKCLRWWLRRTSGIPERV